MSVITGLERAIERMALYMDEAGARALISRKSANGWSTTSDVPIIVEAASAPSAHIDPLAASATDHNTRKLTVSRATDLRRGDRVTVTAPRGTGIDPGIVMTVTTVNMESLAPCKTAIAAIEEVAVEQYSVTIERWDDSDEAYTAVMTGMASVIADRTAIRAEQRGALGQMSMGTLIFDPVPTDSIHPMDSITGIPWATGAYVTRLYPVVGEKLEVGFSFTTGETT